MVEPWVLALVVTAKTICIQYICMQRTNISSLSHTQFTMEDGRQRPRRRAEKFRHGVLLTCFAIHQSIFIKWHEVVSVFHHNCQSIWFCATKRRPVDFILYLMQRRIWHYELCVCIILSHWLCGMVWSHHICELYFLIIVTHKECFIQLFNCETFVWHKYSLLIFFWRKKKINSMAFATHASFSHWRLYQKGKFNISNGFCSDTKCIMLLKLPSFWR